MQFLAGRRGPGRVREARLPLARARIAWTPRDGSILLLTLRVAAVSTLLILPLGVGAGLAPGAAGGPGRTLAETLLCLPLVLPPTAVGLLLLEALRRRGPLGRLLDAPASRSLFTWKAVVLATRGDGVPPARPPGAGRLRGGRPAPPGDGPLARGAARSQAFRRVTLPLAWRGILAGTLLAFSRALGEFGATILVAGNIPGRTQTLALAIFQRTQIGQDDARAAARRVTVVLAFAAVWTDRES